MAEVVEERAASIKAGEETRAQLNHAEAELERFIQTSKATESRLQAQLVEAVESSKGDQAGAGVAAEELTLLRLDKARALVDFEGTQKALRAEMDQRVAETQTTAAAELGEARAALQLIEGYRKVDMAAAEATHFEMVREVREAREAAMQAEAAIERVQGEAEVRVRVEKARGAALVLEAQREAGETLGEEKAAAAVRLAAEQQRTEVRLEELHGLRREEHASVGAHLQSNVEMTIEPVSMSSLKCSVCSEHWDKSHYSNSQQKNKGSRKCKQCVAGKSQPQEKEAGLQVAAETTDSTESQALVRLEEARRILEVERNMTMANLDQAEEQLCTDREEAQRVREEMERGWRCCEEELREMSLELEGEQEKRAQAEDELEGATENLASERERGSELELATARLGEELEAAKEEVRQSGEQGGNQQRNSQAFKAALIEERVQTAGLRKRYTSLEEELKARVEVCEALEDELDTLQEQRSVGSQEQKTEMQEEAGSTRFQNEVAALREEVNTLRGQAEQAATAYEEQSTLLATTEELLARARSSLVTMREEQSQLEMKLQEAEAEGLQREDDQGRETDGWQQAEAQWQQESKLLSDEIAASERRVASLEEALATRGDGSADDVNTGSQRASDKERYLVTATKLGGTERQLESAERSLQDMERKLAEVRKLAIPLTTHRSHLAAQAAQQEKTERELQLSKRIVSGLKKNEQLVMRMMRETEAELAQAHIENKLLTSRCYKFGERALTATRAEEAAEGELKEGLVRIKAMQDRLDELNRDVYKLTTTGDKSEEEAERWRGEAGAASDRVRQGEGRLNQLEAVLEMREQELAAVSRELTTTKRQRQHLISSELTALEEQTKATATSNQEIHDLQSRLKHTEEQNREQSLVSRRCLESLERELSTLRNKNREGAIASSTPVSSFNVYTAPVQLQGGLSPRAMMMLQSSFPRWGHDRTPRERLDESSPQQPVQAVDQRIEA
jgi:hypothetical protein